MKVAVLSESPADEAAIRVFLDGLLEKETEPPSMPPIRSRGWNAVLGVLPAVLRHLRYETDAEGLVVVVDSDRSAVHLEAHEAPGARDDACRLCEMKRIVEQVEKEKGFSSQRVYGPLKTALGLAVPQIEAWYRVGRDPGVSEPTWIRGLGSQKSPYAGTTLKREVYGTDRPKLAPETKRATEEAQRIVREGQLPRLEELFPGGFGAFARDVRSW